MKNQGTVVSHQYKVSNAFMNLIEQSLRAAGRKYNTFVRKHERAAPQVYKVATLTDRLTKGLKRKRVPQDKLEVPSCTSMNDPVTRRRFTPLPFHLMTLVALFNPSKRVRCFACLTKQFLTQVCGVLQNMSTKVQPWTGARKALNRLANALQLPSHVYAHDARFRLGVCPCRNGIKQGCACPPYFTTPTPAGSVQQCISVPNGQLLFKHKSREQHLPPIVKHREVLAYASHPYPRIGRLVGRALTVFWKMVVKLLGPAEIISMNEMLGFVRGCAQRAKKPRKNQVWVWAEFDLVDMFPNIERPLVMQALQWLHDQVISKRAQKHPLRFFIGKGTVRKEDNCDRGDTTNYHIFNFHDLLSYIRFDLTYNTVCKVLSSILMQQTRVPIGGSLSAQLASLVLIYRELTCSACVKSELNNLMWVRYRDNFITCILITIRKGQTLQAAVQSKLARIQKLFAKVFHMKLTLEQWGELDFLECHLGDITGSYPITMRHIPWTTPEGASTPSRPQKMMDQDAPSACDMLTTFVPNEVKKCAYYRMTASGATNNLQGVIQLMQQKGYTKEWWQPRLRHCANKWGLKLPGGPCAPRRDHARGAEVAAQPLRAPLT